MSSVLHPDSISPPAPDWDAMRVEVVCPLCEYNLRGLSEPRCPECGYRFQWSDLLDPRRREHPYLFEHYPRRNAWSFCKTACHGLRPFRFWSSLRPDQSSRPARLLAYWVTAMLLALLLLGIACAGYWVEDTIRYNDDAKVRLMNFNPISSGSPFSRGYFGPPAPRSYFDFSDLDYTIRPIGTGLLIAWAIGVAWPWGILIVLMIFQASMRRAKVKPIHVLRCVLYSADAIMWAAMAVAALCWIAAAVATRGTAAWADKQWMACLGWIAWATILFCTLKLSAAYQKYLRFSHAWATIIVSQIILFLVAMVITAQVAFHKTRR